MQGGLRLELLHGGFQLLETHWGRLGLWHLLTLPLPPLTPLPLSPLLCLCPLLHRWRRRVWQWRWW